MGSAVIGVLVMAAAVFGVSATSKLRNPAAYRLFRTAIEETGLLQRAWLARASALVAAAEAITTALLAAAAVLMCAGAAGAVLITRVALLLAALLMAVLILGVAGVMRRGVRASCPCFGTASELPLGMPHLIRNLVLGSMLLLALGGSVVARPGAPVPDSALAIVAGLTLALLLIRTEDLAVLLVPATAAGRSSGGQRARRDTP
jgi:hypothetical protein